MPKIELYTGSATGTNVPVAKSAISTNLSRADYLLEGRINNDNIDTANLTILPTLVENMASKTNPVEGDKFFYSATSDIYTKFYRPLVLAMDASIKPINLNGSTTFILTKDQTSGVQNIDTKILKRRISTQLAEKRRSFRDAIFIAEERATTGDNPADIRARGDAEAIMEAGQLQSLLKKYYKTDTIKIKRIIIPKPVNFMPITTSKVAALWGVDLGDFIDTFGHWTYLYNCDISIDGEFASAIDEDQRPSILYSEPFVDKEFIELVIALKVPHLSTDDRFVVEIDFNFLCEITP